MGSTLGKFSVFVFLGILTSWQNLSAIDFGCGLSVRTLATQYSASRPSPQPLTTDLESVVELAYSHHDEVDQSIKFLWVEENGVREFLFWDVHTDYEFSLRDGIPRKGDLQHIQGVELYQRQHPQGKVLYGGTLIWQEMKNSPRTIKALGVGHPTSIELPLRPEMPEFKELLLRLKESFTFVMESQFFISYSHLRLKFLSIASAVPEAVE